MNLMMRAKMLFFDVNETLLDLDAMKPVVGEALGSRPELLSLWFTTMLQYSLVVTVVDQYQHFGEVGVAALLMVARNHGVNLSPEEALRAVSSIMSLPAHPDVRPALEELKSEGFRMVTLTNSSQAAVDAQMQNANLTDLFEKRLSVEEVQLFKPHSHVYKWAARRMGLAPEECMLVAAHGWDVAGAIWSGWRAAFISRPGAQLFPLAPVPEIVEPDMRSAAERLIAMQR
jgi:2-haloacid dehalogenase